MSTTIHTFVPMARKLVETKSVIVACPTLFSLGPLVEEFRFYSAFGVVLQFQMDGSLTMLSILDLYF